MNLLFWKRPKTPPDSSSGWQLRPNDGQGIYTSYFNYIPRKIEAKFYEFLRETIPMIDSAIGRLISLDGYVTVKGDNDTLVDEIQNWIDEVPVNDVQKGLQAFHQSITNEAFEQGFGLGEFVTNKKRTDIVQLRTADSKYIKFKRIPGGIEYYQRGNDDIDYRLLKPDSLIYFSINNENQNPYGVPLMRSCEFVSKILITMQNSLLNVWERFGDPSFSIIYKTSKRDGGELTKRRKVLEDEFSTAIRAKREGKSADFIRAIDTNSEIEIKVIGADGQILELEVPARHVLEQIVAKTGLPPWMLGLHWSTTERLSDAEVGMLLADVHTRQSAKLPHFNRLIKTMLLLRGRSWKKGDWSLEFKQVNLHDVVKKAQARFLNAQADMYYLNNAESAGIEISLSDLAIGQKGLKAKKITHTCGPQCGCKELGRPAAWPELDRLEDDYEKGLKENWQDCRDRVLVILKLDTKAAKSTKQEPEDLPGMEDFTFTVEQRAAIMNALSVFFGVYDIKDEDSAVRWIYGQAYSLGLIRAVYMIGKETPILDILKNREILEDLYKEGFNLVKDRATKRIIEKILPELEAQVIAGTNPVHVARRLRKLFDDANSDWERLARSELAMAAERAKIDEWKDWEIKMIEFIPAPDACPICMALTGDYEIGKVPLPVRDTHPRCRCSTRPAESETS